jgi:hypothetical protein
VPQPLVFTVKGLADIQRGFRTLQRPELSRVTKPAFGDGSKKILVPEVKAQAKSARRYSPGPSRNRGKRGKKGPLASKVTTRLVKRSNMPASVRANQLFAYSTAPRAWYRHFVIKGTQQHSVRKGARVKGNVNQIPPFVKARDNDFVGRAQKATEPKFVRYVNDALMRAYKQRARAK